MPAGFTAFAYYNDSGALDEQDRWDNPVWVEIENIRDATTNDSMTDIDASTRGGDGFMEHDVGLRDASIEFGMLWQPSDPFFTYLIGKYETRRRADLVFLDDDITENGAQGLRALFYVTTFTRNEPLDDVLSADVTLVPGVKPSKTDIFNTAYSDENPAWVTVPF